MAFAKMGTPQKMEVIKTKCIKCKTGNGAFYINGALLCPDCVNDLEENTIPQMDVVNENS